MTDSKHTKGPWHPHFNGMYFTIDSGPGEYDPAVAHVHVNHVLLMSKDEAEANAHLIAAAPEMLKALQSAEIKLARYMDTHGKDGTYIGGLAAEYDASLTVVRAAIAKAGA